MPGFSFLAPAFVAASRDLLGGLASRRGAVGEVVSPAAHSPTVRGGFSRLSKGICRAQPHCNIRVLVSIALKRGCGELLELNMRAGYVGLADEALAQRSGPQISKTAVLIQLGVRV